MSKLQHSVQAVVMILIVGCTLPLFGFKNTEDSLGQSFFKKQMLSLKASITQNFSEKIEKNSESLISASAAMMMTECTGTTGVLGGTAFGDFDYDGNEDSGGVGIPNVKVYLFGVDGTGASVIADSVLTDELGHYTFSGLTDGDSYRVEFFLPDYLSDLKQYSEGGSNGTDNTTGTQLATVPDCQVNAGFAFSEDFYGTTDPTVIGTCFVNGNPNPQNPPADDDDNPAFEKTVVWLNWSDSGGNINPPGLANAGETGSVYGLAHNRFTKTVFTSAFIKRHVGLGPLGLGGIYSIDITDIDNPVVTQFVDVATIGINVGSMGTNTARGLPDELNVPSNDPTAFTKVAAEGIGAIAVNEFTNTLWLVNLFDKRVYSIAIDSDNDPGTAPTAADVSSFALPADPCNNGEFRPFGIHVHRGKVYVGGNCDGSAGGTVADLDAYIYELNGSSFTQIATADLDYTKGYAASENSCDNFPGWFPWRSDIPASCSGTGIETVVYPTPVLSDLKFDTDGSLILGFMDRMGHQIGYRNYPLTGTSPLLSNVSGGDILRLHNNQGTFVQESNGQAGDFISAGAGNGQGPGGGEFYFMDLFAGPGDNIPFPPHIETAQGDLAVFPGSNEIATTSLDPYSTLFNSGGINYMNNQTGVVRAEGAVLYQSSTSDISTFSKGNGLGGLLTVGQEAPATASGLVWNDTNGDGIQDGGEMPIAGVNVALYSATGALIANTTTNSVGLWSFSSDLDLMTEYYVVFGQGGQFNTLDGSFNNSLFLTQNDTGMWLDPDRNDSDAIMTPSGTANDAFPVFPSINFTTGSEGWIDNDLDAGFSPINANPIAGVGGTIFNDADGDGFQDGPGNGEGGVAGVTVTLFDSNDNQIQQTTTDANGDYFFPNVPAGMYYVNLDPTTNTGGLNYEISPMDAVGNDATDSDFSPTTMNTDVFNFDPANGNFDVDGGLTAPVGTVNGFVFNDIDMDGIQDPGEGGISNATVLLFEVGNAVPVQTVTTDANGNYTLVNVEAGDYFIDFDPTTNDQGLSGLSGSPQDAGGDDSVDSDADANAGETNIFSFDPTVNASADFDAGFFQPTGTISGTSFNDTNGDGIQDSGDTPIVGVTVNLLDDMGNVVQTVTTDANGNYVFTGVIAGDYTISFDSSTNSDGFNDFNPTLQDQGSDDTVDSDINSGGTISISGFDPMNPVIIDGGFVRDMTSVSGFVFTDADEDGIQDNNETGIDGVTVNLVDNNGDVVATTMTSGGGNYTFTGVVSGTYTVVFVPALTDFEFSPQDQGGDDTVDSDVNATGSTNPIVIDATNGGAVTNVDAGIILDGATVMGFVFKDCDSDGVFTASEDRLSNVPVSVNGNDMVGNPINQSTMTDANGLFDFTGLPAGTYTLTFSLPAMPEGLAFTTANQGANEQFDSDADTNTGTTPQFTLSPGETFQDFSAGLRDIQAPVFVNPPADEDVSCSDPDFNDPPVLTATDNCTPSQDITITFMEEMENADGNCSGITITRTWTAVDACGNTATHVQTLNATDNTPPVITLINPDLVGLMDGDTLFFDCNTQIPVYGPDDAEATDTCDDDPEITFEDFLITQGDCAENGFLTEMYCGWIATDDCGNSDTLSIYLVVNDDVEPTLIGEMPSDITITCADEVPEAPVITASDNCDEDIMVEFDETIIGDTCDLVKITRKWTAIDECGNMAMKQYNIFIETPDLEINGVPEDVTLECEDLTEAPEVTLSHECHDVDLTFEETIVGDTCAEYKLIRKWTAMNSCGQMAMEQYTLTVMVDSLQIVGVPNDITVDCSNVPAPAEPTLTNDCYQADLEFNEVILNTVCEDYQIVRTWTASDACGNIVSATQNIFVETEELGLTGVPADITVDCTDDLPPVADPQPTSDCYEVTIDYGETIIGDTCENYKILRVWVANDFCGNQIMEMQTIIVEVPELQLTGLAPDITYECSDEIPAPMDPVPNTNCYEVNIEFQENIMAGDCPNEFTIQRNWAATDACGNIVTHEQLITVIDTTAPVITIDHPDLVGVPSGSVLTYDCSDLVNFEDAAATAIDNCMDGDIPVQFMEMNEVGDCEQDGFIIRMECCWKAEDDCGNQSEYCITVIITDTQAPTLVGVPADLTVDLAAGDTIPDPAVVTVEDACSNPEVFYLENTQAQDCGYLIIRTWLTEDDCNNNVFQTQTITVEDVCDCPDIVVDEVVITDAECGGATGGSISVMTAVSPNVYDFILLPAYGTPNENGNVVTDLPPGSYLMIVNLPDVDDCDEKIYFNIEQGGCADEVNVDIADAATEYCIDESLLDFDGTITSAEFCSTGDAGMVIASDLDENCLTLTPADGFEGTATEQICVIHCFNGSSIDCDTTFLNVTVTPVVSPCNLAIENAQTANDLCGFGSGSIAFDVTGATGELAYTWTDNVSTNSIASGLNAGTYGVTITEDGTDCTISQTFTIGEDQLPPLEEGSISVTDASCNGQADGQIVSNTSSQYSVFNSLSIFVGMTPLSGLPAGDYVVEEESGDCTANLSVSIGEPVALEIITEVSNETCDENDGAVILTVEGNQGTLTYFWSPNVSSTAAATGLTQGTYSVTVMDMQGCTAIMDDIVVGDDCTPCNLEYNITASDVACADESTGSIAIEANDAYVYTWSHDGNLTGPTANDLPAGTYGVTITETSSGCAANETVIVDQPTALVLNPTVVDETCTGNDGSITIAVNGGTAPYGYAWSNGASDSEFNTSLTAGVYGLTVTDANGCSAIVAYMVEDDCTTTGCDDFILPIADVAFTDNCSDPIGYCLDAPFTEVIDWDITINGVDYAQSLLGCDFDTTYVYNYQILPDQGAVGPYVVTNWIINGQSFTGNFDSIDDLVNLMNMWDTTGSWALDEQSNSISGGDSANTYTDISVVQPATTATGIMEVNATFTPQGTQIVVSEGSNELVFTDTNGCSDTLDVTGYCLETDTREVTIPVAQTGAFCPDFDELPGDTYTVEFTCNDCDNVTIDVQNNCLLYTGTAVGEDVVEITVCDDLGVCDITFLVITVTQQNNAAPIANDDFYNTEVNTPLLLNVLENDIVMGDIADFDAQRLPQFAELTVNLDRSIRFVPNENFCGEEVFTYYVCNEVDCDKADVTVRVNCDAPKPVTGFSPNGDGVNEFFVIENIEMYEDNTLVIFNRHGLEMFRANGYQNNWRGNWRGRDLPDGTYFFTLRYDGGKFMSGWVQVNR